MYVCVCLLLKSFAYLIACVAFIVLHIFLNFMHCGQSGHQIQRQDRRQLGLPLNVVLAEAESFTSAISLL